jgi:hypothetical protein
MAEDGKKSAIIGLNGYEFSTQSTERKAGKTQLDQGTR